MDVFNKRCGLVFGLFILMSTLSVQAASIADQFEVAKTKLFFNLSTNNFTTALSEAEQQLSSFQNTPFENEWRYWLAISQSRNNRFDAAIASFEKITTPLFEANRLEFELAIAYLQNAEKTKARQAFKRWLQRKPTDIDGQYYLAFTYFPNQASKTAEILQALDNQLQQSTNARMGSVSHDQIVYLLAASQLASGNIDAGRAQAVRLQNWPNGSEYAQAGEDLLTSAENQKSRTGWMTDIALISSYDSNISLENEAPSDIRNALSGSLQYNVNQNVRVSYQGYYSLHWQSEDYNLWANQFFATYSTPVNAATVELQYSYSHNFLNQQRWQNKHEMRSQLAITNMFLAARLTLEQNLLSGEADTWLLQPSASYRFVALPSTPTIEAKVQFKSQQQALASTLISLKGQTQHSFANWRIAPNLQWQMGIYGDTQSRESLQQFSAGLAARRPLGSSGYLGLSSEYMLAIIEPDVFSYQRALASLTLGWRF